jgi:hypothetical protein
MLTWTDDGALAGSVTGPGGPVTFESGERIYLLRDGRERSLVRSGDVWRADLDAETGAFVLALDRVRDSGVRASFEVPSPFAVSAPASAPRHDPLTITWDPRPLGQVTLSIEGPCVAPFSRALATDTGRYTINPGEVAQVVNGSCVVDVAVTRSLQGDDPTTGLRTFSYRATRAARTTMVSSP